MLTAEVSGVKKKFERPQKSWV